MVDDDDEESVELEDESLVLDGASVIVLEDESLVLEGASVVLEDALSEAEVVVALL